MANGRTDMSCARVKTYTAAKIGAAERHNERKNSDYGNVNVDPERIPMNVHYKDPGDQSYMDILREMEAAGAVSRKGLRADAALFDEVIFDVNTLYFEERGGYDYARDFYAEAYRYACRKYGEQNILSAVMHADEINKAATEALGHPVYHYHMHLIALPVVEKEVRWSKRCKDPALVGTVKEVIHQISHSKKWASQEPLLDVCGMPVYRKNGKPKYRPSYSVLQDEFYTHMVSHGYEGFRRGKEGSTAEHLSVVAFKTKKESERLAALEAKQAKVSAEIDILTEKKENAAEQADEAIARMNDLAPKLEDIEDFARQYSADAERVVPEAGALEGARSYREKKIKPLFEKLIKALRSLYRAFQELKETLSQAQKNYYRLADRYASLDESFERVAEENKELKSVADDYDTLCREFGKNEISEQVRRIREKEAAEKAAKERARMQRRRQPRYWDDWDR